MKAWLILGCEGHTDKETGFRLCPSVENIILDLETQRTKEYYLELIQYLDRVPKLFEGECFKTNLITNAIYKIYEFGCIEERLYKYIAYFYEKHKHCGLSLYIKPKENESD